ncbi:MAG: type IV pilus modification protein PilV [Hydrogenophilales bacterium]|jgi:type IV pilus assembly protein PilV|nr:type IV pilus modification protein PilV [Hydrogenophilales bacterium]
MRANIRAMNGASLIEVLVTMVIVAIGLLGLAGLQVANFRNAQDAYYRSQATFLANDILDRMRVNRAAGADYEVAVGSAVAAGANAIAVADVAAWKNALASQLPDGEGSLAVAGDLVTVRVEWDDRRPAAAAGDPCYVAGTRMACFVTEAGL